MSQKEKSKKSDSSERRILDEALEMAVALDAHGLITKPDMIQMRVLCQKPPVFTAVKVAKIRKLEAHMSQSVFARVLNVSVSTVQKWESPDSGKRPSGAAAKLLQIIEKKGVKAVAV